MKNKRQGREIALQMLYQWEAQDHIPLEAQASLQTLDQATVFHAISQFLISFEYDPACVEFVRELVFGILSHLPEIDAAIQRVSEKWKIARMNRVDRNVLRLAVYELLFRKDLSHKVVINEAIEIAKRYGGEHSGAFINGILDAIAKPRPVKIK